MNTEANAEIIRVHPDDSVTIRLAGRDHRLIRSPAAEHARIGSLVHVDCDEQGRIVRAYWSEVKT